LFFRRIFHRLFNPKPKDTYEANKFKVLKYIGDCKVADIGRISRGLGLPGDDIITICQDLVREGLIRPSSHPIGTGKLPTFQVTHSGQNAIRKGPLLS